jgi:oligopeptide/dipeptide ABC transporter ATP-binding protein
VTRPVALQVVGLSVVGPGGRPVLDGVDLALRAGEVTAIVGETGSGKTTLLSAMLGLLPPGLAVTAGRMELGGPGGTDLLALSAAGRRRHLGRDFGYVPQDVRAGLNPLMTARACVREAARRGAGPAADRADAAMRRAGLSEEFVGRAADRRPARLSGGECQRVLIAQAIVNDPRVLLLDEPTAALDPPARRAVQATARRLAGESRAVCLVTHDLSALPGLADTIGVMYLGRIVELGPAEAVLAEPLHPYTRGLLGCVPRLDARAEPVPIPGDPPADPGAVTGCKFHPRCALCETRCRSVEPPARDVRPGRRVACHVVAESV